jgi:two-component system, cell cycle response regulator DivK
MSSVLGPVVASQALGTAKAVMKRQKRHILIVDDFKDTREMYEHSLSHRGFRVAVACDGQEALDKAFELQPDLIVMDLSMPVMNGWQATRRLKADERSKHIPIVMLTASPLGGLTPALVEAGFEAVLIKPCLPDDMVAEIRRVLKAHGKQDASSASGITPGSAESPD